MSKGKSGGIFFAAAVGFADRKTKRARICIPPVKFCASGGKVRDPYLRVLSPTVLFVAASVRTRVEKWSVIHICTGSTYTLRP